jgi:all-trans-8'-apo-beta-carotenal 15,15'-oxygenase
MISSPSTINSQSSQPGFSQQDWQGGTRSLPQELDYWVDDITGTVPADLQGTLFRNGPGLLDIGGVPLRHPFDGDGMICAFRFAEGRVHFRNRYVRTQGFVEEQAAGKILYRGVFGTAKPGGWLANLFDVRIKNIANTQVLYWGDQLLALWEADRPYRLNPANLETLGEASLDGVLAPGTAFSAHPRIVPGQAGEPTRLVNFGLKVGLSSTLSLYELDPAGQVVEQFQYDLPGFAFIHDFAVTPHYCILFQNPVQFNPVPFLLGWRGPGECLQFQAKQPTKVWVIPRHGQGQPRCLTTEACFVFHHVNAYEVNAYETGAGETGTGQLVIDSVCYPDFPTLEPDQDYRNVDFSRVPGAQLWRFQVDLSEQTVSHQVLNTRSCEFPAIHPSRMGQSYRYCYIAVADQAEGNAPLQTLMRLDMETGAQQVWSAAPRGFIGEPIYVPKGLAGQDPWAVDATDSSTETAGWLLVLVYDAARQASDLVILDGEDLTQGPVARLHLPHLIPYGLHGSFTPHCF